MRSGDVVAGRYRLEEAVGTGGMGEVWRATDLELRRDVALKLARTGDDEEIRREARIGAGLHHPNVISVFDVAEDDGRRWLVMEYLPARSLAEICRTDGPISPELAARVGTQIAGALAAMHAKGMVHRDITPANILVTEDGTAKLADLGVAMWDQVTLTGSAKNAGTAGYVAPEVIQGYRATPKADLYALGVTLSAATEGQADKHLTEVLATLSDPNPDRRPTAAKAVQLFGRSRRVPVRMLLAAGVAVVVVVALVLTLTQSDGPPDSAPEGRPGPRLLFGVGDRIDTALASDLVREAPVGMLTTNYHKPADLETMADWRDTLVPDAYAKGYALHVVVSDWDSDDPEGPVDTRYGPGCGRPHPLTPAFLEDMRRLAEIFAGKVDGPPLYVTVFQEVNKFACEDGSYSETPEQTAYYRALQDNYLLARQIIRETAPNAQVAMGWDGYQVESDHPDVGGGRSMFEHFADALRESDYQAVLAKQPYGNIDQVRRSVRLLGEYGKVMVAAYGNKETRREVFDSDMKTLLSDDSLDDLTDAGLFAWSFNTVRVLDTGSPGTLDLIEDVIRRTDQGD